MLSGYVSEQCAERLFGNQRARDGVVRAGFVDDALDIAAAASALHKTPAGPVDLARASRPRQRGLADLLIGHDVAKADIHAAILKMRAILNFGDT